VKGKEDIQKINCRVRVKEEQFVETFSLLFFHKASSSSKFLLPQSFFSLYLVWVAIGAESGEIESGLGCWTSLVRQKLVGTVGRKAWLHASSPCFCFIETLSHNQSLAARFLSETPL